MVKVTVNLCPLIPFLRVVGPVQAVTLATAKMELVLSDDKTNLNAGEAAASPARTSNPVTFLSA